MADAASPRRGRGQLFAALAVIALAAMGLLALLVFLPRSTVVELRVVARSADFTLVPQEDDPPFFEGHETQAVRLRGVGHVEAIWAGRRAWFIPDRAGSVRLEAADGETFGPELTARRPVALRIAPPVRDRAGQDRLVLTMGHGEAAAEADPCLRTAGGAPPAAAGAPDPDWLGSIPVDRDLTLVLKEGWVVIPEAPGSCRKVDEERFPINAASLSIGGSSRQSSPLGLTLEARPAQPAKLWVIDPATGASSEPQPIAVAVPELRIEPWQDQLVILEPPAGEAEAVSVLRSYLQVRDPRFFEVKPAAESHLLGGQVRFPFGEKEPVDLERGFFLSLAADEPWTLRSLGLGDRSFELVLWGEATSLKVGPTPARLMQHLPSHFDWLYKQKLAALIYTTMATVLGTAFTLFKIFGLVKSGGD